jgi:hypothetical protein
LFGFQWIFGLDFPDFYSDFPDFCLDFPFAHNLT